MPPLAPLRTNRQESNATLYSFRRCFVLFSLNVDAVDLDQYPRISNVHYNHSQLFAGDCLYLPGGLLHQVNSLEGRNLAISILFTGPSAINAHYHPAETLKRWGAFKSNVPCEGKYAPVSTVDVAWMYKGDGIHTMGFLNPKVIRTALREFFSPCNLSYTMCIIIGIAILIVGSA